MQVAWFPFLGWEDPLEKETATHSSILTWETQWAEEPGWLLSMGSQRVRRDLATERRQQGTKILRIARDDQKMKKQRATWGLFAVLLLVFRAPLGRNSCEGPCGDLAFRQDTPITHVPVSEQGSEWGNRKDRRGKGFTGSAPQICCSEWDSPGHPKFLQPQSSLRFMVP